MIGELMGCSTYLEPNGRMRKSSLASPHRVSLLAMSPNAPRKGTAANSDEVRQAWNANATFWDSRMGEGNSFHRTLLLPSIERLLSLKSGERVLDVACGNGQLSRWMTEKGARVVGIDLSEKLIEIARNKPGPGGEKIDYRVVDASDGSALSRLGPTSFDAIVCNMALMDMTTIDPLAKAIPSLLKPGGRFIFSVMHPCFNAGDVRKVARESEEGGVLRETVGVEVRRYLTARKVMGLAMVGQPAPQPYFERPLHALLNPFLRSALVLDALEEPTFPNQGGPSDQPWYSWSRFVEIPPALVVRMIPRVPT